MKKLIFRKFAKDTTSFFILMCLIVGLIVWTVQAVNYFDFVVQDGHGLRTYFFYIILNFPKIIHRIIPFIFFISLFYIIIDYELRNELLIYWTSGVSKLNFANKIIIFSFILTIFQIIIGGFFSPYSQFKGREILKESNIDFFTSLIKEGKFINAVDGLTIFIKEKNQDDTFKNIYIDDSSKNISKIIYAKNGSIIEGNKKKVFRLFNGQVINKDQEKINLFEFDQIDFNLADYSTKTILVAKIQEIPSLMLFKCRFGYKNKILDVEKYSFSCEDINNLKKEIEQELFKRFYKPLYIPLIAIMCCFLIIVPRNNAHYKKHRKIIFFITILILILSEASLRYSSISYLSKFIYIIIPWIIFLSIYLIFYKQTKNA